MLEIFITSRVRRKIIVVFTKYPDFRSHVRGIAKLIKEDPGNLQRELKRLESVGLLGSEKKGNTKVYFINRDFILLPELRSMVLKAQQEHRRKKLKKT